MLQYPEEEPVTLIDASVPFHCLERVTCHSFLSVAFGKMKYLPLDSCRVFKIVRMYCNAY